MNGETPGPNEEELQPEDSRTEKDEQLEVRREDSPQPVGGNEDQKNKEGGSKITRLTDSDTSLEERLRLARELFPPEQKEKRLLSASRDSQGRPVRYFRKMTYSELGKILSEGEAASFSNPQVQEGFSRKQDEIKKALRGFLEDRKLLDHLSEDTQKLFGNFTLENYINFVQMKLPRIDLFRLQISDLGGGSYKGITGLTSISVGVPCDTPSDPSLDRVDKEGIPVVEMIIPDDQVYVYPLFKTMNLEMEKEVNTRTLHAEWIVDVYQGESDLTQRFVRDPESPPFSFYGKDTTHDGLPRLRFDAFAALQDWAGAESILNLIPKTKLTEMDESNPDLQKPLVQKGGK